jgi:hypothetical protein
MRIKIIATLCLLACVALSVPAGATPAANSDDKEASGKETFSALAYLPTGIGPSVRGSGATADVTINIESYSSDQDAQELQAILLDGGPNALLKALEKMKTIGRIERVGTISFYDFKFISSTPTATGRRIFALTDRPIGFLEAYLASRSTDYKFGILQLDLRDDKKGKEEGVGTLIYAGQIKVLNGNNVEIENFGIEPIRLEGVHQL